MEGDGVGGDGYTTPGIGFYARACSDFDFATRQSAIRDRIRRAGGGQSNIDRLAHALGEYSAI